MPPESKSAAGGAALSGRSLPENECTRRFLALRPAALARNSL